MPFGVGNVNNAAQVRQSLLASGANSTAADILTAIAGAETNYGNFKPSIGAGYGTFNVPPYFATAQRPVGAPVYQVDKSGDLAYNAGYVWQYVTGRGRDYSYSYSYVSGKYRNFLHQGTSQFIAPGGSINPNGTTNRQQPQQQTTGQNLGSGQSNPNQIVSQAIGTFLQPNATGGGFSYTPGASFTKTPVTLAPTASVTSFLNNIDQFQQLINPANVVGIPDISILGYDTQLQNPIDWFEGFFFNLMADFGAFIVDAFLVITGVYMVWKVVNSVTDISGKLSSAASLAGKGIALG